MDIITQAALGACIGQAAFSKKFGGKALVVGAFCGVFPDLDFILTMGGDNFDYMATHRGVSHSVLVLPVVALFLAWLAMQWEKRDKKKCDDSSSFKSWYYLCFWALITHPLLDLFTSYGTQIFEPFSNERYTLNGVSIIDLFYTVPILLAILIGFFLRKRPIKRQIVAKLALAISSFYLCIGLVNSWDAKRVATAQLSEASFSAVDVHVSPTMLNNVLWRVVAKDQENRFAVGFFSSISRKPIMFNYYQSDQDSLVDIVINTREGQILKWFSMDMLRAQVKESSNGNTQIELTDMRFGLVTKPVASFFGTSFKFDNNQNIETVLPHGGENNNFNPSYELEAIWSTIIGNDNTEIITTKNF